MPPTIVRPMEGGVFSQCEGLRPFHHGWLHIYPQCRQASTSISINPGCRPCSSPTLMAFAIAQVAPSMAAALVGAVRLLDLVAERSSDVVDHAVVTP